ncbi:MAG: helix-turn-helix domain-containing protein [Actinomycetota bacterium]
MPRASKSSPEKKIQVVLSVLRGEATAAAAGRKAGVSEQTVHNWKRVFLESGREGLAQGQKRRSSRELELEAENEELKAALGEAHVQLRVWKKGAEFLPPSRTSR